MPSLLVPPCLIHASFAAAAFVLETFCEHPTRYELEQRQAAVAATALEALKETPQTAALWEALPPERSVLGADGRSFNPRLGQESAPLLLDCVDKTRRVFIGHVWPFLCHRQELAYVG